MKSQFTYSSRPMIRHRRSQFDLSRRHLTTINMGDLVPIYWEEVLPGDTIKGHMKEVIRTTTPFIKPIMDNLFVDTYFFFVPNRLVMNDWQKVIGDDSGASSWSSPKYSEVPSVGYDVGLVGGVAPMSLADYFGIPVRVQTSDLKKAGDISSLLFRGYALIYNEWFRDENNEDPVLIQLGDALSTPSHTEDLNSQSFSSSNYTGMCAKVNKVHDRFTSALPSPQKGNAGSIGVVATTPHPNVPVVTSFTPTYDISDEAYDDGTLNPLQFYSGKIDNFPDKYAFKPSEFFTAQVDQAQPMSILSSTSSGVGSGFMYPYSKPGLMPSIGEGFTPSEVYGFAPSNLKVDIPSLSANLVSINDIRYAFQLQKYLEKDARGGTRYIEFLREHFGVTAGDARLQRPEYLGGKRTPVSIYQQNQTSAPTEDSPLGQVAGWSLTQSDSGFNKSFVEHGYIIGLACVRQFHTYQQGIHPSFYRHTRYDYYDPVFSNIGEQPIYTRELFVGGSVTDETIFGYQEAWSEYRQGVNRVSGLMRSTAPDSLDIWHLGDRYLNAPVLGAEFLQETSENLDRVLSVESHVAPQFIFDTYIDVKATRVMPTYSIPGLIDHH